MRWGVSGALFGERPDGCEELTIAEHDICIERDRIRVRDNWLGHIGCLHMIGHAQHLAA